MKTLNDFPRSSSRDSKGFALVVSLTMLVLLVIIALGMISLSSISLRTTAQTSAQAEAQANARMALMIAIGELQRQAGPDTRITAPADIIDVNHPPLLGVWNSWEGSNHETSGQFAGRPIVPDYSSKDNPIFQGGRFRSWLVSSAENDSTPEDAANLVSTTATAGTVPLVSKGSIGTNDGREVHVQPNPVGNSGALAWWVSGENQKARLPRPRSPENNTVAGWAAFVKNHAVGDPGVFGLESLLDDASPAEKTYTLATTDLYTDANAEISPGKSFHDLSTSSMGLLTNVATGGWRKDLSLLTERWDEQPENGLEFFQLLPDESLLFNRPTPANMTPGSNISHSVPNSMPYHWADYLNDPGRPASFLPGPTGSWTTLANWAIQYRHVNPTASSPRITSRSFARADYYNRLHNIAILQKIARLQFIISHYSIPGTDAPNKLIPCILYTPVITLWNPYNVEIGDVRAPSFRIDNSLPVAFEYQIGGTTYPQAGVHRSRSVGGTMIYDNTITDVWNIMFRLPANISLKPGETRVFSPEANSIVTMPPSTAVNVGLRTVNMRPGFRSGGGFNIPLNQILDPRPRGSGQPHDPDKIELSPATTMKVVKASFDNMSHSLCGVYGQWTYASPEGEWLEVRFHQPHANTLYPPLTDLAEVSLDECRGNPKPFMSMVLGMRNANHTHQATKGFVQASPLADAIQPGHRLDQRFGMNYNYVGGETLIHSAWDYSFKEHSSGPGDTLLPDVDEESNSGYIVSGFSKADGVPRCVVSHFPLSPISSLGELSHWNARHNNTVPPFGFNVIGNSDATPLVAADQIHVPFDPSRNFSAKYTPRRNLQYDDSYVLNHVFFDDWFVSSIAPQPDGFGPGGGTFEDTYKAFIRGETKLANLAYRAIREDLAANAGEANARYEENVESVDSWRTIASRLEVEGMFNVNSTSVKAWRALLGHARNQRIPYINAADHAVLSEPTDHAFPRSGVAGDARAGTVTPATYAFTTEFTGYRVFDSAMLDRLAEEVVNQVRLRGPFLSLSEFVNRRLSTDATERELALSGAIQAALNVLAQDNSLNPFLDLQNESNLSVANPPGPHGYSFPEAAVGHSSYGLPGWTRQADILGPLAPVLSARDDTFTIRAYGESRRADGSVQARAWCETVVKRTKNFINTNEAADITGIPQIDDNRIFGRRFEIISFRWLNRDEV